MPSRLAKRTQCRPLGKSSPVRRAETAARSSGQARTSRIPAVRRKRAQNSSTRPMGQIRRRDARHLGMFLTIVRKWEEMNPASSSPETTTTRALRSCAGRARAGTSLVATHSSRTFAARSRATKGSFVLPRTDHGDDAYVAALADAARQCRAAVVLPCNELAIKAVAGRESSSRRRWAVASNPPELVVRATDKGKSSPGSHRSRARRPAVARARARRPRRSTGTRSLSRWSQAGLDGGEGVRRTWLDRLGAGSSTTL